MNTARSIICEAQEIRNSMWIRSFFLVVIFSLSWGDAWSDSIHLKNGSHIVGAITGMNGGKLVVKTEFAGEISIVLDAIESIETDRETGYKLDTGEVLSGQLHFDDGRQKLLIGETHIDAALGAIVAIGDPVELSGPMVNWLGRAEFGATFKDGNTDELDLNALISTTREGDSGRLTLLLRGEYVENNDIKTDNAVFSSARYEYDLTERRYVLGISQVEYDEFEDLDLRLVVGGGVGYFFVNKEHQLLKGLASLVYQHEQFADGTHTDNAMVLLGYEYRLDLHDWFQFRSESLLFANITTTNDWRFYADNAIEVPVSSKEAWKIRFGIRNEYDNEPEPGIEQMDTTAYSSLVFGWE